MLICVVNLLFKVVVFCFLFFFFFFNDTSTTDIYTLSLHDALPIYIVSDDVSDSESCFVTDFETASDDVSDSERDRKSTRLNSSHVSISYAVFCLKKKNE